MTRFLPLLLLAVGCYDPPPELPEGFETPDIIPKNACAVDRLERVFCVLDGDTFDVGACGEEQGERVRMLGVDAPEIAHDPEPADCWGDEAHAELRELIEGRRVVLTFDEECTGVFGRTLAYVWLTGADYDRLANDPEVEEYTRSIPGETEPALLLNEWLISRGAARVFPEERFGSIVFQDALELAEADAAVQARGLWRECEAGSTATP